MSRVPRCSRTASACSPAAPKKAPAYLLAAARRPRRSPPCARASPTTRSRVAVWPGPWTAACTSSIRPRQQSAAPRRRHSRSPHRLDKARRVCTLAGAGLQCHPGRGRKGRARRLARLRSCARHERAARLHLKASVAAHPRDPRACLLVPTRGSTRPRILARPRAVVRMTPRAAKFRVGLPGASRAGAEQTV